MASLDLDTPEAKGKIYGELLFGLIYPPIAKYQIAADRAHQQDRNLHLAFALAAYRSDHKAYPKSLDALVPQVHGEGSGRPLHRQAADLSADREGLLAL